MSTTRRDRSREDRSPRVVVVVPTYNEAENLPRLVERLTALGIDGLGFVIVDDGSPDGTGKVADRLASEFDGWFQVIHRSGKQGLGRAYVAGFAAALEAGPATIVEMDADLSHPPEEVPNLLACLAEADVAVASRYIRGGSVDPEWSWGRRMISYWGNRGIRWFAGLRVRDATSGFKAFRRETLEVVGLENLNISGFGFQAEVAAYCQKRGLRVVEHPYAFVDRKIGKSKMSLGVVVEAFIRLAPLRCNRH